MPGKESMSDILGRQEQNRWQGPIQSMDRRNVLQLMRTIIPINSTSRKERKDENFQVVACRKETLLIPRTRIAVSKWYYSNF
jgi:hypothetical protein